MKIPIFTIILILASICAVAVYGKKYCGDEFSRMVAKTCVFPGETQPCLGSAQTDSQIQRECCQKGCDLKTIQKACCFTEKCLNDCYPGKGHKMGVVY